MTYNTKTIYPAQEDRDGRKFTTTKQTDIAVELKKNEVLKLYNSYREAEGYEYNVNVTLKVNDETTTNINDPLSWTDEDNVFKVSPKTSTDDAEKLHQLYDTLNDKGYEVEITIKPKAPKSTDMDSENETFATQLSAYPDGTLVTFRLSNEKV
ncbi:hypothetical protein [Lactobacillus crispatus]|uniref:hypothetical protein n=1 Tax=Lactobacillus crispatus TaxID=47770 RepID=UPI0007612E67|nr:hypothetical protein [Lactobacillus crispatus]KWU08878.1 hypothetical protein AEL98_08920 [Lactobacillus crispatus]